MRSGWAVEEQAFVALGVVLLGWLTWGLCPAIAAALAAVAMSIAVRDHRVAVVMVVAALGGTPALGFTLGVGHYMRQPLERQDCINCHNLDPELRVYWVSSPCLVSFVDLTIVGTANVGVWVAARTLGPPPGAYRGTYPTPEEALHALLSAGEPVEIDEDGRLLVAGDDLPLSSTVADELERLDFGVGAVVDDDVVVLMPLAPSEVLLIDAASGRVFARYVYDSDERGQLLGLALQFDRTNATPQ